MKDLVTAKRILNLDYAVISMLQSFVSNENETSLAKGIPVSDEYLECAKALNTVFPVQIRYRGPRRKAYGRQTFAGKSTCLKADADTFAIYERRVLTL